MNLKPKPSAGPLILALLVVFTAPLLAGDHDTHLAMTHYLARRAGLSEHDAALLASANQSMDENIGATALPFVDPGRAWERFDAAKLVVYAQRGAAYHSLGDNVAEVRANLEALRRAIPGPEAGRETRLIAIGQYLHSLQDVFFHQHDGMPYGKKLGHLFSGEGGHKADKVALRFDSAILAADETAKMLAAVARDESVPDIDWDRAYRYPIARSVAKTVDLELVKVASAISHAYDGKNDLDDGLLESELKTAWVVAGHTEPFEPFVHFETGGRAKIDYDASPGLLSIRLPELSSYVPGGISFSAAAAARLPLRLSLKNIWSGDGQLVLAGPSVGDAEAFDPALLLTAFRLACGRGDPQFSLDPVDGAAWTRDGKQALEEIGGGRKDELLDAAPIDVAAGERLGTFSFRRLTLEGSSVASSRPSLASKLMFYPEWLRGTRFGKVLYEADVLLKVLSSGLSIREGDRTLPAPMLTGYHSWDERLAVGHLLGSIEGKEPSDTSGYRLWFQLRNAVDPQPWSFNLPPPIDLDLPDFGTLFPTGPADERALRLERVTARLRESGLVGKEDELDAQVTANLEGAVVAVDGNAMDLGGVWPQMFVRKHDAASGQDVEGEQPGLQALAKDVNSRLPEWTAAYPELQALVNVFRAYVAAVKVTTADRSLCDAVAQLPLLAAETLGTPLPQVRPSVISLDALSVFVANPEVENGSTLAGAITGTINGGVALVVKDAPGAVRFVSGQTPGMHDLAAALRGDAPAAGREAISLRMDLDEAASSAGTFVPVTEADVLGSGADSAGSSWRTSTRRLFARVFANQLLGDLILFPFVCAVFLGIRKGWRALVARVRGPRK